LPAEAAEIGTRHPSREIPKPAAASKKAVRRPERAAGTCGLSMRQLVGLTHPMPPLAKGHPGMRPAGREGVIHKKK